MLPKPSNACANANHKKRKQETKRSRGPVTDIVTAARTKETAAIFCLRPPHQTTQDERSVSLSLRVIKLHSLGKVGTQVSSPISATLVLLNNATRRVG